MDVHGPIHIRCDTRCPVKVNVSESATYGQYGLTLLRKCHSHNIQEWKLAAERAENRFWQNKRLINRTYLTKEQMGIVLMTNSVLYKTFDGHCSFFILIFLWINLFSKTYGLPFSPPIIECMEALESVHSWKGDCTMCYQLLVVKGTMQQMWQNNAIFMFKWYCSAQFNQVHH